MNKRDWAEMTSEERIKAIARLAEQGLSAGKIAAHFMGASRNAVIGYCVRHGITLVNARPTAGNKAPPTKSAPTILPPPPPIDPSSAVPFWEAVERRLCKWPLWDSSQGIGDCCGMPRKEGSSYCEDHIRMSIRQPELAELIDHL